MISPSKGENKQHLKPPPGSEIWGTSIKRSGSVPFFGYKTGIPEPKNVIHGDWHPGLGGRSKL